MFSFRFGNMRHSDLDFRFDHIAKIKLIMNKPPLKIPFWGKEPFVAGQTGFNGFGGWFADIAI
jgi:hypothetical protein